LIHSYITFIHIHSMRPMSISSQLSALWTEPPWGSEPSSELGPCLTASQRTTNWATLHPKLGFVIEGPSISWSKSWRWRIKQFTPSLIICPEAVRHEREISNAGRQKLDFAEIDQWKPVLLGLSLVGNLVKPLLSLYRTDWRERGYGLRGDSLRDIPFSHGTFLRHNGARERSIIQFTDLLSYWLSIRVIRGNDSSGKQFLDIELIFKGTVRPDWI
jgi:hypothetical protein